MRVDFPPSSPPAVSFTQLNQFWLNLAYFKTEQIEDDYDDDLVYFVLRKLLGPRKGGCTHFFFTSDLRVYTLQSNYKAAAGQVKQLLGSERVPLLFLPVGRRKAHSKRNRSSKAFCYFVGKLFTGWGKSCKTLCSNKIF